MFGFNSKDKNTSEENKQAQEHTNTAPVPPTTQAAQAGATSQLETTALDQSGLEATNSTEGMEAYQNLQRLRAKKKKKGIIIASVLAGFLVLFAIWHFGLSRLVENMFKAPGAAGGNLVQIKTDHFTSEVKAQGSVEPISQTIVSPTMEGTVESIAVSEGQQVHEGDTLFSINNPNLDRAVREAALQVKSAKTAVANAQQGVRQAQAKTQQPIGMDMQGNPQYMSQEEANALVANAQQAVQSAVLGLESAQNAYNDAVKAADTRIVKAPISGTVLSMNLKQGAPLSAAMSGMNQTGPLMQIADVSQMKVVIQVNENSIRDIQVGQKAKASFSALPGVELDCSVSKIAASSTQTVSVQGSQAASTATTYAVELLIPHPDPALKPGMTAEVSITTLSLDNAMTASIAAVDDHGDGTGTVLVNRTLSDNGGQATDAKSSDKTEEVPVRILASSRGTVAIEAVEKGKLKGNEWLLVREENGSENKTQG